MQQQENMLHMHFKIVLHAQIASQITEKANFGNEKLESIKVKKNK